MLLIDQQLPLQSVILLKKMPANCIYAGILSIKYKLAYYFDTDVSWFQFPNALLAMLFAKLGMMSPAIVKKESFGL